MSDQVSEQPETEPIAATVLLKLTLRGAGEAPTLEELTTSIEQWDLSAYGVTVKDGRVVRCGNGPHVTREITVHLTKDNVGRLARYVELWKTGMAEANGIRDRISSRRAQGQAHRAAGRSHWNW